ncbi:MAG TPA: class I SAM-dependent methyltransferase [Candidatus Dormibacteraeota bacterium]|nr:class I SAM-dependent methyltransferase [Candidatus Dormibacteraeota bacterium]
MSEKREFEAFDRDVDAHGGYVYVTNDRLSSRLATDRQVELILHLAHLQDRKAIDVGCGDGSFSVQYWDSGHPSRLVGIDPVEKAIAVANARKGARPIEFATVNAVRLPYPDRSFDVAILQGVLHHTNRPADTIKEVLRVAPEIVVVEPNGYSPILKVLEKASSYHRAHHEQSYTSRTLDRWVRDAGGEVLDRRFAILVPYFCPDWLARVLKRVEPLVEALPLANRLACAVYVFRARLVKPEASPFNPR